MENRTASVERVTKETKIRMTLNLDGTGKSDIHTDTATAVSEMKRSGIELHYE